MTRDYQVLAKELVMAGLLYNAEHDEIIFDGMRYKNFTDAFNIKKWDCNHHTFCRAIHHIKNVNREFINQPAIA